MRVVFTLAMLVAGGCDAEVSRQQQCVELRDQLVDIRLAGATVDVAAHRAIMKRSLDERFIARCEGFSSRELECVLAAKDSASVVACSSSSPQ